MPARTSLLTELRTSTAPERVLTEGRLFDAARQTFVTGHDVRPAVVLRCESADDVQAGIQAARRHGLLLSVRGGGHDFYGRAVRDGALVLDLTALRHVEVDVEQRVAVAGGGALSRDVVTAAEVHGLTAVTGTAGTVGLAGLTLGGGYGPLIGRYGLAADNLEGAEVVLADGTLVDTADDPDLLWALRGGGGNFGVVTSLRVRLHRTPTVLAGTIAYPLADASAVLSGLDDLLADCHDELEVDTVFMCGPDGNPALVLMPTWSGEMDQAAHPRAVEELSKLGTHAMTELAVVARSTLLGVVDQMFPFHQRDGVIRTRNIAALTEQVVPILEAAAHGFTSPHSYLLAHQFHGSATRIPPGSTAFGRRDRHFMVEVITLWDPAEGDGRQHVQWADETAAALTPHALPGGYVNLLGPSDGEQIAQAYGDNTARLLGIKERLDPDHVFTATPLPGSIR